MHTLPNMQLNHQDFGQRNCVMLGAANLATRLYIQSRLFMVFKLIGFRQNKHVM